MSHEKRFYRKYSVGANKSQFVTCRRLYSEIQHQETEYAYGAKNRTCVFNPLHDSRISAYHQGVL